MSELRIRNVDEWVVESLRQRARATGKASKGDFVSCYARKPLAPS